MKRSAPPPRKQVTGPILDSLETPNFQQTTRPDTSDTSKGTKRISAFPNPSVSTVPTEQDQLGTATQSLACTMTVQTQTVQMLTPSSVPVLHAPSGVYVWVKQLLDFCLALLLFIPALPLILFVGLLVKLTSRGPMFYGQTRLGRHGKPFTIYKIRTMEHDCERLTGPRWCRPGDSRVLPVGRFLRKTHLDELPQLWNILLGQMSLIGPRPERPEFVPQLEQAIPRYRERLLVLPGVTGLAQVHLAPDTDLASVRRKLAFDLYYIRNLSFWQDFRLLVLTFFHVLRPYAFTRWFFRLNEEYCLQDIGGLSQEVPLAAQASQVPQAAQANQDSQVSQEGPEE